MNSLLLIIISSLQVYAFKIENNAFFLQSPESKVQVVEEGAKQFLVSKDAKTEAIIKKLLVWPGTGDGNLSRVSEVQKSKKAYVLKLAGTDGDYSFFELVAWNPETGDLVQLIGGDSFSTTTKISNETSVDIELKTEEAPDAGQFHLSLKPTDKTCASKISEIAKLVKEKSAVIKKAGRIPNEKDSKKISDISEKMLKIVPSVFHFDLQKFSDIKITCE